MGKPNPEKVGTHSDYMQLELQHHQHHNSSPEYPVHQQPQNPSVIQVNVTLPGSVQATSSAPYSSMHPTAPMLDEIDGVRENTEKPPPYEEEFEPQASNFDSTAGEIMLSEEDAREYLLEFVKGNCCYGRSAANLMDIKITKSTFPMHLTLETFIEKRKTGVVRIPYDGGPVDGPRNGPAPLPWKIPCSPTSKFEDETIKLKIPNTTTVKNCGKCQGKGWKKCKICRGRGLTKSGEKRCTVCQGLGKKQCKKCDGCGKFREFVQMTVNFENKFLGVISSLEGIGVPKKYVQKAIGTVVSHQEAPRVAPIQGCHNDAIQEASADFVQKHVALAAHNNSRILQQRQILQSVPVFECEFTFEEVIGRFWIYGEERAVYIKDYPQTCCYCCSTCTIC